MPDWHFKSPEFNAPLRQGITARPLLHAVLRADPGAPGPMWDATTRNRAPHKPLLLLAVMDLVARGVITSRRISITGELVELNELFTDYWRSIVPVTRTSSIAFPFSRLHREPFWKLLPLPGREITGAGRQALASECAS